MSVLTFMPSACLSTNLQNQEPHSFAEKRYTQAFL